MALYLGSSEKLNVNFVITEESSVGDSSKLLSKTYQFLYYRPNIINPDVPSDDIRLLSFDGYVLTDSNGVYLLPICSDAFNDVETFIDGNILYIKKANAVMNYNILELK